MTFERIPEQTAGHHMSTPVLRLSQVRWSFLLASVAVPLLIQLAAVPLLQGLGEPGVRYYLPALLTVGLVLLFGAFRGQIVPFVLAVVVWLPAMYYLSIAWGFGLVVWLYGGP